MMAAHDGQMVFNAWGWSWPASTMWLRQWRTRLPQTIKLIAGPAPAAIHAPTMQYGRWT